MPRQLTDIPVLHEILSRKLNGSLLRQVILTIGALSLAASAVRIPDDPASGQPTDSCTACLENCGACPAASCDGGACSSNRDTCKVTGGNSSEPTDLRAVLLDSTDCTVFVLGDGYYGPTSITRSGITIRASHRCSARLQPELEIRASNVVVDGVSMSAEATAIKVYEPGTHVRDSCIQGFGRSTYGNGIWIFEEALDASNRILIENNSLADWGGYMYSGGIAIGRADDDPNSQSEVTVEVRNNRITGGPTTDGIYNAAIQSFHPFIAYGNYIHTVNGTAFQNKTFNSYIACNQVVNNLGDGALYNRSNGNNVWVYNIVHDSHMGIDHFTGDGNVFRGNIIYNTEYIGRIKNHGPGTTNLLINNNTFYNISGWAGWIWDPTSGGSLSNIVWRNNIFHTVNGNAIADELTHAWDEYANDFFQTSRPAGTTGYFDGSSVSLDPRLAKPPADFTVLESTLVSMGAQWPLPCP